MESDKKRASNCTSVVGIWQNLVEHLDSNSETVRLNACHGLALVGLEVKDPDEVASGLNRLAEIIRESGPTLTGEKHSVRAVARTTFITIGSNRLDLLESTLGFLKHESEYVRHTVLDAVSAMSSMAKEAVPILVRVMQEDEAELVQCSAAKALGAIGPSAIEAVPSLLGTLELDYRQHWPIRRAAVQALGAIGPAAKEAVPELSRALLDKDRHVRMYAATALRAIGPIVKEIIPTLIRVFQDDDYVDYNCEFIIKPFMPSVFDIATLRDFATEVLRAMGPLAAEPVLGLIQKLYEDDHETRSSAARALGAIGPTAQQAVPALIQALQDNDSDVRQCVVRALGAIGPKAIEAVPSLGRTLLDKDRYLRMDAMKALKAIGPLAKEAVPALIQSLYLHDDDRDVRECAVKALAAINPTAKEVVSALVHALEDDDDWVRVAAGQGLQALESVARKIARVHIAGLRDDNPRVRRTAGLILGALGRAAEEAVPALSQALLDEAIPVREAAEWALGVIGSISREAIPSLISALLDDDDEVRAKAAWRLQHLGPAGREAKPALIRCLNDEEAEVRRAAAWALKAINLSDKEVVPSLIRLLDDDDDRVRVAAVHAIQALGQSSKECITALIRALQVNDDEMLCQTTMLSDRFELDHRVAAPRSLDALRNTRRRHSIVPLTPSISNYLPTIHNLVAQLSNPDLFCPTKLTMVGTLLSCVGSSASELTQHVVRIRRCTSDLVLRDTLSVAIRNTIHPWTNEDLRHFIVTFLLNGFHPDAFRNAGAWANETLGCSWALEQMRVAARSAARRDFSSFWDPDDLAQSLWCWTYDRLQFNPTFSSEFDLSLIAAAPRYWTKVWCQKAKELSRLDPNNVLRNYASLSEENSPQDSRRISTVTALSEHHDTKLIRGRRLLDLLSETIEEFLADKPTKQTSIPAHERRCNLFRFLLQQCEGKPNRQAIAEHLGVSYEQIRGDFNAIQQSLEHLSLTEMLEVIDARDILNQLRECVSHREH